MQRNSILADIEKHLNAPTDEVDPLAAMRCKVENYGRGEHGPGLSACVRRVAGIGDLQADWFTPQTLPEEGIGQNNEASLRILYLHGGGWCAGSRESHASIAAELAYRTNAEVLLPEYRLAPEHPFPAGLDDATFLFRWIMEHGSTKPATISSSKTAIVGDSAGANLAASYCVFALRNKLPVPGKVALLSPLLEIATINSDASITTRTDAAVAPEGIELIFEAYGAQQGELDPLVAPGLAPHAVLKSFPETLIQVSGAELLREQSIRFSRRLWEAGVRADLRVFPDMPHVWHAFLASLPEAKEAISDVASFLARDNQ